MKLKKALLFPQVSNMSGTSGPAKKKMYKSRKCAVLLCNFTFLSFHGSVLCLTRPTTETIINPRFRENLSQCCHHYVTVFWQYISYATRYSSFDSLLFYSLNELNFISTKKNKSLSVLDYNPENVSHQFYFSWTLQVILNILLMPW